MLSIIKESATGIEVVKTAKLKFLELKILKNWVYLILFGQFKW